jgi:hypothetical protein
MKPRSRRGFILPLVIMITMALSLGTAIILERNGATALSIRRQLNQHSDHHTSFGIRDIVDAWIRAGQQQAFRERVGEDGRLVDIEFPEGFNARSTSPEILRVWVRDAQDTVLADLTGLTGQTLRDARSMLQAVHDRTGNDWLSYTRKLGPAQISAQKASRDVLSAVVFAATESAIDGESFVSEVIQARDESPLTTQKLTEIATNTGLDPEQQAAMLRMIVADTSFWRIRVELVRGDTPIERFEGYLSPPARGRSRDRNAFGGSQRTNIFDLHRVRIDPNVSTPFVTGG